MYGVNTLTRAPRASRFAVAVLALATFSMAADPAEARSRHKGHGRVKAEKAQQEAPAQANIFSALFSGTPDKTQTGSLGRDASADAGVSDSRSANRRGRSSAATTAARGSVPSGTGIASFYGGRHHGGPTASGERFNQNAMTAAHRSAPLGSQMRVTNLNNGKTIVVRINDRGPFVRGRIIDVSKGAAQALGFVSAGLTRVKVEPAT